MQLAIEHEEEVNLHRDLTRLLNCHSLENGSDTPDYILANYILDCLEAFDRTVQAREKHYGREVSAAKEEVKREAREATDAQ